MLDQWNMFGERSELDAALTRSDPDWETQQKVYVACNYCGKSISGAGGRQRSSKSGTSSRQTGNGSKPQVGWYDYRFFFCLSQLMIEPLWLGFWCPSWWAYYRPNYWRVIPFSFSHPNASPSQNLLKLSIKLKVYPLTSEKFCFWIPASRPYWIF